MKNYKGYDKMPYCESHYPKTKASVVCDTPEMLRLAGNTKLQSNVNYTADFEKNVKGTKIEIATDPELERHLRNTQVVSKNAYSGESDKKKLMDEIRPTKDVDERSDSGISNASQCMSSTNEAPGNRPVKSIADYDPMNGEWGSLASSNILNKFENMLSKTEKENSSAKNNLVNTLAQNNVTIGNNKINGKANNISNNNNSKTVTNVPSGVKSPASKQTFDSKQVGFTVKALYDYVAADQDEISFQENDIIVNCHKIDEGWMSGTLQRNLQHGMLPANYVEIVKPVQRNIYIN
uniref:SH3 domain-containing protein n=1 Tax=Rhabditophanes sp. KR3021 TaxID=114890 RepID=A0AC35UBD4_9BILA